MEGKDNIVMYSKEDAGEKLQRVEYCHNYINFVMEKAEASEDGYTPEDYSSLLSEATKLLNELPPSIDGLQINSSIKVLRCDEDKPNKYIVGPEYIFFFENLLEYISSGKKITD